MMSEWEYKLALHQKLCEIADLILRHFDPCQMKNGGAKCLASDPNPCCIRTRFKRWDTEDRQCYFVMKGKGCTFPNLECKVWLCPTAIASAPQECIDNLNELHKLGMLFEVSQ